MLAMYLTLYSSVIAESLTASASVEEPCELNVLNLQCDAAVKLLMICSKKTLAWCLPFMDAKEHIDCRISVNSIFFADVIHICTYLYVQVISIFEKYTKIFYYMHYYYFIKGKAVQYNAMF